MATTALIPLVQSLPQELIDEIETLTLTTPDSPQVLIDWNYKPPKALQISHATRAVFARTYYTTTTTFILASRSAARCWAETLPSEHLNMIKHFAVSESVGGTEPRLLCDMDYNISRLQIHTFQELMMLRERYVRSLRSVAPLAGTGKIFHLINYNFEPTSREWWLVIKSGDLLTFVRVDEHGRSW